MAGENCIANVPINHQFALIEYGKNATDPYAFRFAAENFGLRRQVVTVQDEGTGVPWDVIGSAIESRYPVSGTVTMVPRPDQIQYILPCLFGNAATSPTTFKPAGVICDFFHIGHWDPTVKALFRYEGLVTQTWRLQCSDSSPLLRLEWAVEGAQRTQVNNVTTSPWNALGLSIVQPWVFRQASVNVGGVSRRVKDVEISGNNNLDTKGSTTRLIELRCRPRSKTSCSGILPRLIRRQTWRCLVSLRNVTGQVVFTSGTKVLTIDFPSLFARPEDPNVQGRQRIHNTIEWKAQYDPSVVGETPIVITYTRKRGNHGLYFDRCSFCFGRLDVFRC